VRLFRRLKKNITYLNDKEIEQIENAFLLAKDAHSKQKRTSGEPYITHPLSVATILAEMHMDADSIIAAILHDVIEDTEINKERILQQFGNTVAELVDGVTKLTKINFSSKAEAQAESFLKMVLAMYQDIRVILIKLADRLHNMRTMKSITYAKRKRVSKETLTIYAPIAHRLGMHDLYTELEDLSFSASYPLRYKVLKSAIKKSRGNRKEILKDLESDVIRIFNRSNINFSIISREKHIYSIYQKMKTKHLMFSGIMDVYGFRLIVNTRDDCYRALGIAHSIYKPVPGRFKDYIALSKINGYQSLHTSLFGPHGVPVEIQIRTKEMDHIASKGIAAHWFYKSSTEKNKSQIKAQEWISNMLEMQRTTLNPLEFVDNVKRDLFPDQIYIFTSRGGIMELPRGATVIDFAYAIHTDIGNSCIGAKIDRKYVPLSEPLSNGQTVVVITSKRARPNPAWLDFVRTGKARSAIRHNLKYQKTNDAVILGRKLLEKALLKLGVEFSKINHEIITAFRNDLKLTSLEKLYEDIGIGNRTAVFVAHQIASKTSQKNSAEKQTKHKPFVIKGAEGMVIHFSHCCYPLPGDPIVGFISKGHGLIIHRDRCQKISSIRNDPDKYIFVSWDQNISEDFLSAIKIRIKHHKGAFADLSKSIADSGSNIEDITILEKSGDSHLILLKIYVKNKDHLIKVMSRLSALKITISVTRM